MLLTATGEKKSIHSHLRASKDCCLGYQFKYNSYRDKLGAWIAYAVHAFCVNRNKAK